MSSSNDGKDGDKDRPFRKVQTTNLLKNDDNMSSLSDLLDVFLRIRHGLDQQEVIMISETQLETFGPFIAQQLANLTIMAAHYPDDDSSEESEEEDEVETNPAAAVAEADVPESEGRDDDEQKTEKDEKVVKT